MCRVLSCCFALILLVISIAIIGISLYVHMDFDEIMDNRIKSEMIISKDSSLYDEWLNKKTTETTKFYVFEVENPVEILNGMKPKVKEVGPFVFRVQKLKENIQFSMDKTIVSYTERKVYTFNEIMSIGSIEENLTVINLQFMVLNPMLTQLSQTSNTISSRSNNSVLNSIYDTFRSNIFVSKPIREILFGGTNDSQIRQISQYFPTLSRSGVTTPKLLPQKFALFANNTENKFEVLTGHKTGLYSRILKWNDKSSLSVWTGRSCNLVNGTNGFQFSPLIQRDDRLFEYSTDICRSIEMSYESQEDIDGIPIYRFSPVDNAFYSPKHNKDNTCYCLSPKTPEKCNFIGILDLSSCTGAPLILSNPHFRRTSEVITKSIDGLSPEERLHHTFIEVEPISGLVTYRARRYQLNVHTKKCPLNQNVGKTLKEAIIPLVWFEELAEVDDNSKDTIKYVFVYPIKYEEVVAFGLIILGGVLLITSLCCCCCCGGKNKKVDPISSQHSYPLDSKPIVNTINGPSLNGPTLSHSTTISHNYDQIFKGQTPLNRLKDNPPKRPSYVTQSSGAPPPPPPPPPPPLLINFSSDKVISDMKDVSSPDSRQNLLKDIRKGTNLKKVDANQTIATKPMDHSYEEPKSEPKGLIMTSLNTELQKFMRQRSQETMTYGSRGGPQSYYRWNNPMNEKNNSILNERTRFKSHIPPPVSPARPPPLTVQDFIDYSDSKNLIVESMDEIDSDFSDGDEEEVDTPDMERGDGLQLMERHRNSVPMNVTLSDGNNHIPIIHNKSQTIITDIFHMVHK